MYLDYGGNYYNVTPARVTSSGTDILSTTIGLTTVLVTITGHGAEVGDYFCVDTQASVVGGNVDLPSYDSYLITEVNSINTFTIETGIVADSTQALGGGLVDYAFQLTTGYQSNNIAFGYGRSTYGSGPWGSPASSGVIRRLRKWSGSTWGEDFIFSPSRGALYLWDATNDVTTRATLISQAPSENAFVEVIQPSRHVCVYGTIDIATADYSPMLIRWSSSEDYTDWVPSGINTSGDFPLQDGSKILGVQQTKSETLVWTDTSLYAQRYIGGTDIFSFEIIGKSAGLISSTASVDVGGTVFWMGPNGFWMYNGSVTPLECSISKDTFDEDGSFKLNRFQVEKVFAGHNAKFKEIIWFYQSEDSLTDDCDRYIIYNYQEDVWAYGTLDRSCWLDAGLISNPIAGSSTGDGQLYNHELGITADNDPLVSYIESAPFDIGEGDELMFVDRIIPDFRLSGGGTVNISLNFQKYPYAQVQTKGPYTVDDGTPVVNVRGRGRQMAVRVEAADTTSSWQLGKTRIRMKPDGRA
jgi:hypothetical protein